MKLTEWYSSNQNKQLKRLVSEAVSEVLPQGLEDVDTWLSHGLRDGHQFRPYLFLALNGKLENAGQTVDDDLLNIAASIEIAHQASLIVDDDTDEHSIRGAARTALHTKYGHGIAATLSHLFVTISDKLIASTNFDPQKRIAALKLMARTKTEMALGQFADTLLSPKPNDTSWIDWCLNQSYLKTRALIAMPFEATAILKGSSNELLQDLRSAGDALGTAYQIGDDVRDMGPEEGPLTLSLPLAYLLDKNVDAPLLQRLTSRKRISQSDVEELREALNRERAQVLELASQKVDEESEIALSFPEGTQGKFAAEEIVLLVRNIIQDEKQRCL